MMTQTSPPPPADAPVPPPALDALIACPSCEEELPCALLIARTALVGMRMEMKVFKADSAEHAGRIAKSVIGKALRDVPLEIVEVEEV